MTFLKKKTFATLRRRAEERQRKSREELQKALKKYILVAQEAQKATGNKKSFMRYSTFLVVVQECNTKAYKAKKFLKEAKIEVL